MLSRIAESLFWIGRYVERADDTARLLDVQIQQALGGATFEQARASQNILSVMGLRSIEGTPDLQEVTALLAFSSAQPSSIVSSLRGARENARGVRESISSELWECLNATTVALDARAATAQRIGPHEFFRFAAFVRERVAIAMGIADASMSRDDGWRFLMLGRSLERVDMTARLLEVQMNDAGGGVDWVSTLRHCSAYEAYLRLHRGVMTPLRAIEFLLLDRLFPRSVYFSLSEAQRCVSELHHTSLPEDRASEAERIIGRARAGLDYRTIEELVQDLPNWLVALQRHCSEASAAVAEHYFQQGTLQEWRPGGTLAHGAGGSE